MAHVIDAKAYYIRKLNSVIDEFKQARNFLEDLDPGRAGHDSCHEFELLLRNGVHEVNGFYKRVVLDHEYEHKGSGSAALDYLMAGDIEKLVKEMIHKKLHDQEEQRKKQGKH